MKLNSEYADPLCCCEYFDIEQQRNHILACCCNCQDLDASVDSLIMGKSIPHHRAQGFVATFQDRMRIPWHGGARKVAPDAILPIIILPSVLFLSAINIWWTIFMFSVTFALFLYLSYSRSISLKGSNFFLMWSLMTLITISLIFEFIVVPLLDILVHENLTLAALVSVCVVCFSIVKMRSGKMVHLHQMETGSNVKMNCTVCQISIPEQSHYCIWLDCYIGYYNRFLFLIAVFLTMAALLYSSNLTLTSVCHPFRIYKTILLPDDCSEVYEQYDLALSFVSAVYSIGVSLVLGIFYYLKYY